MEIWLVQSIEWSKLRSLISGDFPSDFQPSFSVEMLAGLKTLYLKSNQFAARNPTKSWMGGGRWKTFWIILFSWHAWLKGPIRKGYIWGLETSCIEGVGSSFPLSPPPTRLRWFAGGVESENLHLFYPQLKACKASDESLYNGVLESHDWTVNKNTAFLICSQLQPWNLVSMGLPLPVGKARLYCKQRPIRMGSWAVQAFQVEEKKQKHTSPLLPPPFVGHFRP